MFESILQNFPVFMALWFGILTSISPCPLAMNIAAVSFLSKKIETPFKTIFLGILYTFGRVLTYLILGGIIFYGTSSIPELARWLQIYMNKLLGPFLIIISVVLLEFIKFNTTGMIQGEKLKKIAEKGDYFAAFLIGFIFALAFCPVSAALFFGSVFSLNASGGKFIHLVLYGIGTGIPVLFFAVVIATGSNKLGLFFNKLSSFEYWARRFTGVIFLLAGIYYTLIHIFGINISLS